MSQSCATVTKVTALEGYIVELTFSDGVHGIVDLKNRIVGRGGIFSPLENPDYFREVSVNQEFGTIVWPNGADFCPDLLYAWTTGRLVPLPESQTIVS
jgi:hypothetical protein